MGLKKKKTKGRQIRVPKTERWEWRPEQREATVLLAQENLSSREVSQRMNIPSRTVRYHRSKYSRKADEMGLSLSHFEVYQDEPRSGRPSFPSDEEKERIFKHIIFFVENRKKTAAQHISEMKLQGTKRLSDGAFKPMSVTKFNTIMYEKGYGREHSC